MKQDLIENLKIILIFGKKKVDGQLKRWANRKNTSRRG